MANDENGLPDRVEEGLDALRRGEFVLIYDADGREEETDFVIPSVLTTPEHVRRMRRDGGGLICTTVSHKLADKLGLPFLVDIYSKGVEEFPLLDELSIHHLPYDEKSAFSLTINHRETYTGITDNDRAMTIARFGRMLRDIEEVSERGARTAMGREFRAPGHVHLLRCSEKLLESRFGHTELSTAMIVMSGLSPSATICEMMGDDGNAISRQRAWEYANDNGYLWLKGSEVIGAWKTFDDRDVI